MWSIKISTALFLGLFISSASSMKVRASYYAADGTTQNNVFIRSMYPENLKLIQKGFEQLLEKSKVKDAVTISSGIVSVLQTLVGLRASDLEAMDKAVDGICIAHRAVSGITDVIDELIPGFFDGIFNKFGEEKSRHSKDELAAEISDESEIIRQTHIEKSVKVKRMDLNNEIMDSSDALQQILKIGGIDNLVKIFETVTGKPLKFTFSSAKKVVGGVCAVHDLIHHRHTERAVKDILELLLDVCGDVCDDFQKECVDHFVGCWKQEGVEEGTEDYLEIRSTLKRCCANASCHLYGVCGITTKVLEILDLVGL